MQECAHPGHESFALIDMSLCAKSVFVLESVLESGWPMTSRSRGVDGGAFGWSGDQWIDLILTVQILGLQRQFCLQRAKAPGCGLQLLLL